MLFGPSRCPSPLGLLVCATIAVLSHAPGARADDGPFADLGKWLTEQQTAAADAQADVALGGDQARTRFLIGLARTVDYQVFALSNPNRVIVELGETALQLPKDTGGKALGLVSSFRAGMSGPGKARVVIDVTEPVVVESAKIEKAGKGQRLVLQIVPAALVTREAAKETKKPFNAQSYSGLGAADIELPVAQPPLPLPAVRPEVKAAKAFKPIIVIDPGHGGHDTGTVHNATVEKDAVLAFSKVLKKKIEATGHYRVLMTRDTDVFVDLGERVAFAERNKANLFMAVHADDAGGNSQARGATIYSLRESTANALQRSAKGDVSDHVLSRTEIEKVKMASNDSDVATVKSILSDLAGRDLDLTKERTNMFSKSIIAFMGTSTGLRNEPDQQAGFRVLKTAQFPSVLIELAYVTNKEDAALLKSDSWREKVADSITTAVENYFSNQISRLPM